MYYFMIVFVFQGALWMYCQSIVLWGGHCHCHCHLMEKLCLQPSMFSFHWIINKLADNQSRHRIWDKFECVPNLTIYFRVLSPWGPKSPYLSLWQVLCLFSTRLFWNLQITKGMKSWTVKKFDQIRLSTLEFIKLPLSADKAHIWVASWQNQQNVMCAQQRLGSALIRVLAFRMKNAWVLSKPLSAERKLIRLGECPGWSESSLGAQSFCWFCHEVVNLHFSMPSTESPFSFNQIFELADKQHRHEIWDGPHCAIYFALECWKGPIFDIFGMLGLR